MFWFVVELENIETAQSLGERTHSLVAELRIGVSAGDLARFLSRGSAFSHRRILVEFEAVFQIFPFSLSAEPWRLAKFHEEAFSGDFRELAIFDMVYGFCPSW